MQIFYYEYSFFSDRDGDELLTEDEFANLPTDGMGLELRDEVIENHKGGSEDRRKEFKYLIDKNKDGKADRSELLVKFFLSIFIIIKLIT